jgi:hypothetical protein
MGPFKKVPGCLTHSLVTVNKFTKWIMVRPLANIGSKQEVNLIQDIIFHFRVPKSIITDNGTQFTGENSWISMMITTFEWTGPSLPTHV